MTGKKAAIVGTVASILLVSAAALADPPPPPPPPASGGLKMGPPPGSGGSDHDGVVDHLGVTLFPTLAIPFATGAGAGAAVAPVVGVRYWLMSNLGIDAGVGLGWVTSSVPSPFAMAFHAGLPLALASAGHFTFEVVPEANLGFAHENNFGAVAGNAAGGFLFDVGARVGAEIQFGFIGIPQLAIEGSVGLFFSHTSQGNTGAPSLEITSLTTTLATGATSLTPWSIFANAIQATYYL